jgi:hypothetical protein
MFWLSPGVPRSVAPSGMPEPLFDPAIKPDVNVLELDAAAEPPNELFAVAEPQPEERLEPPPSNWALETVFGHGMTSGLSPGGFSSVAPSGMVPEGEDESESVPSGEVMPMPGIWFACALAAATLANQTIADKMHVPRIKVGLSCSMPVDTVKADRPRSRRPGPVACVPLISKPASDWPVPAPQSAARGTGSRTPIRLSS